MNLNRVELIGHVTADPIAKRLNNEKTVVRFSLATNHVQKDSKTKEKKEIAQFHKIVAWGPVAALCEKYVHKGKFIYLDGQLQTRSWQDEEKNTHYTTEILLDNIIFLGKPSANTEIETIEVEEIENIPA